MSLTEFIPGMKPERTGRNVAVGALYLFTLPLWIIFLPFIAAALVGMNYSGLAERLDRLPGIGAEGGAVSALVTFLYLIVIFAILGSLAGDAPTEGADTTTGDPPADPGSGDAGTQSPPSDDGSGGGDDGGGETTAPPDQSTPTETERPAPTATPTDEPTPEPETTPSPQSFSGEGQHATNRFAVEGGLTVFEMEHTGGDSNFQVWLKNSEGERVELLVNDIGEYDGRMLMNVDSGEYFLDIEADGNWQVTVRQPRPSSGASLSQAMAETDSDYIGPIEHSGAVRVTFEGTDDEHYAVWKRGENGQRQELLFNEVGPTGELSTVTSGSGIWFVAVETSGEWTLRVETA